MRRTIIITFTAIVAVILFVVLFTFVRKPYEQVVLDRFGNLIEEQSQMRIAYNWYFKLPTDSVIRIDTRLHLYTGPLQQVVTARRESISIRTFAIWHITDPIKFYRTTSGSDQRALDIMDQKLRGLVQAKLAAHKLDDFFNVDEKLVRTDEVEKQVAKEATDGSIDPDSKEKQSGLADQGLEIVEVGFSRMAFPPANAEAVYSAMVASLNGEALRFDAEGRAEVARKQAEGEREASRIRGEASKVAQETRGRGDAEAAKLLADAQATPGAQEFYQYWKSLDFWKSMMSKNTVLVLSSNNEVIKNLFQTPRNVQAAPTTAPSSASIMPATPGMPPAPSLPR